MYYEIRDNAGLLFQTNDTIELDLTGPTGSIEINDGDAWTNSTNVILTLIYDDATSGVDLVRYSNDSITWTPWEAASDTRTWALPSGDGPKTVYYEIRNNAGTISQFYDNIGLDTANPSGSIEINGDDGWTNSTSVILTLTYNDATSGVLEVRYSNDSITWTPWEVASDTRAWTLPSGDGIKTVYYEIRDNAGLTLQISDTIGLDTIHPSGSIIINSDTAWTTSPSVTLTLTYNDATSGVSEVRYSNDGYSWTAWEASSATRSWTLTSGDGIKTVYYEIKDNAGLTFQTSDTIGLDTNNPAGSIIINNDDVWSTSTSVTLTLTYNDATSGVSEVRYSNDGSSWTAWEAASATKTWVLSSGEGPKIVYYEIKDNAGLTYQINDGIGLDTTRPTGSIEINGGDLWTNTTSVTLTLAYNDATSGVLEVRYSNDGITWSNWEVPIVAKMWTLSTPDGVSKTVYYEIKDYAEIVSQFNDTIGLDTVDPIGSIEINNGDLWTNITSVTLELMYNDATSGVLEVRYSNDGITWSNWEAASATKEWLLLGGDAASKLVYYEIKDNAGRISQFIDTIGLDTLNPLGSIIIDNDEAWSTSTSVILTLTYSDLTSGVDEVRYSNDGTTWSPWESASISKVWVLTSGDNGLKTVYYELRDNAHRTSVFFDTIGLDTADPTGSIMINSDDAWTNSTNVVLALTFNDATSGIDQVRYSNDGNSWTDWEDSSTNRGWTLTSSNDPAKIVFFEVRDNAGRISQFNDTIGLDTVDPTGSIDINGGDAWTNSTNVLLYLSFDDVISGVDQVRYSNDGSSWSSWEAPSATRIWTLSSGDSSSKVVYYNIRDRAGLIYQTSDTIGLDTANPTGSILINNGDTWTNIASVVLSLIYNDATSGIDQVRYSNDGYSWTAWEASSATRSWTLTSGDGIKTVYYEIKDNAGLTFQTSDTIELDTSGPTGSIIINDNDAWTNSINVILSLTYDDDTSGVDQVRYSNDGSSWTAWEDPSDTRSWTLSSGDGLKTVYYEIKNNAGSTFQTTDTIGLDTINPTGSIIINNDDLWAISISVTLILTYNDATSGVYQVRYSNDGSSWTSWEAPSATKTWTLAAGDGASKIVYYEIKDNAGLIFQDNDVIGLDTADPTGSILINDGDSWTNTTSVSLALDYNDATSGVLEVRYSNDGSSWTSWEAPSATRSWTLSTGDGTPKTVYFEVKDNAQRISRFSDIIGLDTADPTGSILINDGDSWTNTTSVSLTLNYNDATSGVLGVRYSNDGNSWTDWEAPSTTRSWTLSAGDGTPKTVYFEVKDNAQRISRFSDIIGLDTIDPIGSVEIDNGNAWTNSTNVLLFLTYSDATSGVYQVRYSNDGISWTAWETPTATKAWILPSGDEISKIVYYEIKDNASLIFQVSDTIGLDTANPTGSIMINDNNAWSNTTIVTLALTYSDATSGVREVRYSNDGISWTPWEAASDTRAWTLAAGDGTPKVVYYEVKDNAMRTAQFIDNIGLDTSTPSGSIEINGGQDWSTSTSVTLTLTYNDLTSGVDQVRYSNDGSSWTAWEVAGITKAWILTTGDTALKTVYYEIRDNAGLIYQTFDTIGLDTASPTGTILINNDAIWTNSTSVTLTLTYTDFTSGVNQVRYSNDGSSWTAWEFANTSYIWTLPTGDAASKTVYYEIRDNAGLIYQTFDTIGLDTADPTGTIVINDNDAWSTSPNVILTLTYNDATSGVDQVRYSDDGILWDAWETASTSKAWTLSAGDDISKIVYYEIRDVAGRVSQFYDNIGLDTANPTGSILINNGDIWTSSTTVTLALTYSDATSEVDQVRYSNDGSSWTVWEDPTATRSWTLNSGDGSKTVYYEIRDYAGLTFQDSDSIDLDTTAPTGSIEINNNDEWTNITSVILTLTYDDATSGVDQVRYSNDGSSWTVWEDPIATRSWTLNSGDGSKTVYYEIRNMAGKISQFFDTIGLDTGNPTGSIEINNGDIWTNATSVLLTLNYDDTTSGVLEVRYSNAGGPWTAWEAPSITKTWILSSGDSSSKVVYYEVKDNAMRISQYIDTIGLDTTNPTGSIIINDDDAWSNNTTVTLALTYSDATSGVREVRYSNDGISWSPWEVASNTRAWTLPAGDGTPKVVYYEIKDNAMRTAQFMDTIGLDTSTPTGSIEVNGGEDWSTSTSVTLTLTYNDLTSGVDQVRYSNDGSTWTLWEASSATKPWVIPAGDAVSKTIFYEIRDNAGLIYQTSDSIGLDTADPTGTIVINNDAIWTNSTSVTLTLTYNDATSGLAEVRYSNDGTSWTAWEIPSATRAWILTVGAGSRTVFYELRDNAGRISMVSDTIGLDTSVPTGSIEISGGNTWTNSTSVILSLSYSDATSGIKEVRYSNDGILWTSWESPITTKSWVIPSGDAVSKTVYYEIKNNAGLIFQTSDDIGLDTTDPTGTVIINNNDAWTNSTSVTLTLTYDDAISGLAGVRYSNDGSSWTAWENPSDTRTWTLTSGEATKTVFYEIKDNAGLIFQAFDLIELDTNSPTGSIIINNNNAWTTSINVILTLTYNDGVSGVEKVRFSNDGSSWTAWEDPSDTRAWILDPIDGSRTVFYEIRDNVWRKSIFSDTIGLDTLDPTGSIIINNDAIWTSSTSVTLTLTYSDATSGVVQVRYSNDGSTWSAWEEPSVTKAWIMSVGDGVSKFIYYEVKDNAGRISQFTDTIGLDTSVPIGSILVNDDDAWTNLPNVILTLTYNDVTSGIDKVRFSNDGVSWTPWEAASDTRAWTLSSGDGPKTVFYELRDNAGLIFQITDSIGLDTIKPSGSIIINDDDAWTTSNIVNLSITYNDATSGVDQIRFSNDGISWTGWEDPTDTRAWTLTPGEGSKIVYCEIKDNAGIIFQDNDTIGLDNTEPAGSIIINDNDVWTTSTSVILTLIYNDATSGVSEVRYSNDGNSWTGWEDPNPTRAWTLTSGDGSKTVYYEIKDNAGLIFQVTDTIGLDTIGPTGSIIINNNEMWTTSPSVTLTLTYNDAGSGVSEVRYSNDGISWTDWEVPSGTRVWTLTSGDGIKTVYYEIRDNIGFSTQYIDTIGLDTLNPTGSITINNGDVWTISTSVILTLTFYDATSGVDQVRFSDDTLSWTAWEDPSDTKLWTLPVGDLPSKIVYYEIKDNTGRTSIFSDTIGLDSVDPSGSIEINNDESWSNSTSVILTLIYNDATSGVVDVCYSNDAIFWTAWEAPSATKVWTLSAGDGALKPVYFQIRDGAGRTSIFSDTIGLDTVDPTGSININGEEPWITSTSVLLYLVYDDATSGVAEVRYSNNGISWTLWEAPNATKEWTLPDGDGASKTVYYEIKDNTGRMSVFSDTIGLDTAVPTGSIEINGGDAWTTFSGVTLSLTFNDITSGVDQVRFSNDGLSWTAWEDPGAIRSWILPVGDGIKTVYYEIRDFAGLIFQDYDTIGFDTNNPTGSIVINGGDVWTTSTSVSLTLTYSDTTSGVAEVRYSNDLVSWTTWEPPSSTRAWNLSIGDGTKIVYYEIRDTAGLIFQNFDNIGLDTTDPTGSIVINGGSAWTTSTSVSLTLSYNDATSGVAEVRYSNDGIIWSTWEAPSATKAWILPEGDYISIVVYYEVKDYSGRISQFIDTIGLDTVGPTGSIEINGGDLWTNSTSIFLYLTYNDATSGVHLVRYSNDGISWTGWETPSAIKAWSLPGGDSVSKSVYYEIRDNSGKVSQFSDTIGLDTVNPTGSIEINGGDTFTNVTSVVLYLTYDDATSGVTEVRYSNDGNSWTAWEAPNATRVWALTSGDGIKTVYYELKDNAGLLFQVSDTIELDTTGPSGSIIINDNDAWTNSISVTLTLSYSDSSSGVDQVRYSNDGISWTDWEDPSDIRVWSLISGDGPKTVYYEIKNNVGLTIQVSDSIGLDTVSPTGSIIINDNDVWTNFTSISLTLTYNDATSGVDQVRYSNDGSSWTAWEAPSSIKAWVLPTGDGSSKTVYYEIKDNAGLTFQVSDSIGLDTASPTGSIIINDNEAWTTSIDVFLTLTYNDATSGVDQVRFSNDGSSWTSWEAPEDTRAWILTPGDGSKVVYYEIRDNIGRTSVFSDIIGVDTIYPNGSIIINNDDTWTTSPSVSLTLTYNDATSGVDQVRYSNDGVTWAAWEDASTTRVWILPAGDESSKTVYYEIRDNAGLTFQDSDTIGLDTTNPSGSIIINNDDAWTSSTSVTLTLTYNDATSGINQVRYSNDGSSWTSWEAPAVTRAWTLAAGDGSKIVFYEIMDNSGLVYQDNDTIELATTGPTGSVIINNNDAWTTSISVTLTLTYSDPTSGVDKVRFSNDGSLWSEWEDPVGTRAWLLPVGDALSKTIYYEIRNNAGLIFQTTDSIGLDTTDPMCSILVNGGDIWTNSTSVILSLTYADTTSGVYQVRYSNDGSSWTGWEEPNATKAWILSTGEGSKNVYYEIKDNAGLTSQDIDIIELDTTSPTGSIIINDNDAWTTSVSVILSLTYNDASSGVDQVRYSNDGISWTTWEDPSVNRAWTLSGEDGLKVLYYQIRDNAGRTSIFSDTIGLDRADPFGSIVINNGDGWTTSTSVALTLTYNDATSGVAEVRYSNNSISWTAWGAPSATKAWILPIGDGTSKTVYYEIRDVVGFVTQYSDTIGLDTTPPIGSIIINHGDGWTSSTSVNLTLTYNDATSGVDQVRYSNDGSSWTAWETANATKTWVLPAGEGIKTVYYEIRDKVGLISQYTDTIELDTTGPTGSIIINNNDAWTTSISVTLTLTYSDASSGVDQVRYSNDGNLWTSWESPTDTRVWTLSGGDGSKIVYYEIRNKAGRTSVFSDTIGLDTVGPTGSITINGGGAWTNLTNINLILTYHDSTSGVAEVRFSNDAISWTAWETPSDTRAWTLSGGDGSKIVYYEIKDNVGFISQYIDTIGLDTIDPTGSIQINGGNAWTNSSSVILSLTYSDTTSGVDQVRYSNDGSFWSAWEAPSPTKAWTLSTGDGTSKTVYYEVKDLSGRTSQFMDTIGLDTVNPTGSIVINGGDGWTKSSSVSLTLTYDDITSGVVEVRYSNDAISWTVWEIPSTSKAWILSPGDGASKTVYYEIKDLIGRISRFSDTIGLDTMVPSIIINSPLNYTYWSIPPEIQATVSDMHFDSLWYISGGIKILLNNGTSEPFDSSIWNTLADESSFTIYFFANDSAGNINDLHYLNLHKDILNPRVSILLPEEDDLCGTIAPTYQISVDDAYLSEIWYSLDDGITNLAITEMTGIIDQTKWALFGTGFVTIKFYANDSMGKIGSNSVTVRKDITAPDIIINDPNPFELFGRSPSTVNLNVQDPNLDSIWYKLFNSTKSTANYIWTGDIVQSAWNEFKSGVLTIRFYANDTLGNTRFSDVTIIKDITPPDITINAPDPYELFGLKPPNIDVNIIESNPDDVWYQLTNGIVTTSNYTWTGSISQVVWEEIGNGTVDVIFYANDTLSNFASQFVTVRKDVIAPTISINYPPNLSLYGSVPPDIDLDVDDPNLDSIWYRIDNGTITTANHSWTGNIEKGIWDEIGNGTATIIFYANDFVGNIESETLIIRKDIIAPEITINNPNPYDLFGILPPVANVEFYDPHLSDIWYQLYNGTIATLNNTWMGSIVQSDWDQVGNGTIQIIFYANDSLGNLRVKILPVRKDVIAPKILINYPNPYDVFGDSAPDIDIFVDENNLNTIWYQLKNNSITTQNYTWTGNLEQSVWEEVGNGTVTIYFYANDLMNNFGFAEIIIIKDLSAPIITIIEPENNAVFGYIAPEFKVYIGSVDVYNSWYIILGNSHKYYFTKSDGITTVPINQIAWDEYGNGTVTIEFYVNDSVGNIGFDTIELRKDLFIPEVIINLPIYEGYWSDPPILNISFFDPNPDSLWYEIGSFHGSLINSVEQTIDPLIWNSLEQGKHQLFIFANDTAGNVNDTYVFTIYKDTLAPLIVINSPVDGSTSNTPPIFNVTCFDPNFDTLWYGIGIINIIITNNTDQSLDWVIWNELPEGMYQIFIYANDTFGHLNNLFTLVLYKDTIAPIIIFNHPYNNSYHNKPPILDVYALDPNFDSLWYSIGSYKIQITELVPELNNDIWNSLDQGAFQINFYANDTLGNINASNSLRLYKDTFSPKIIIISPLNQSIWNTRPLLNIIGLDPNLKSIHYRVNGGGYTSLSNNTPTLLSNFIWESLEEGEFNIQFFTEDMAGNINSTLLILFKDTTPPDITINSPLSNSIYGKTAPNFEISVNIANLDKVWYMVDGYPEKYILNEFFGTIDQTAWDYLGNGTIRIEFYANDTIGNIKIQTITIRKDILAPNIEVNQPIEGTIWDYPPIIKVFVYDSNLESIWYRIGTIYSSLNNNAEQQLEASLWEDLPQGEFYLYICANDSLGNINDSYYLTLYKDTLAPTINIISPIENQEVGEASPHYELSIIEDHLHTRWYTLDGGLTNITITKNHGDIDQLVWDEIWGSHNDGDLVTIRFYANDTLNHIGYQDVIIKITKPGLFEITNPIMFYTGAISIGALGTATFTVKKTKKYKRMDQKQKKKVNSILYLSFLLTGLILLTSFI
ncbi:MAG: hypothetical protein ACFFAV_04620 [Candidatus Hermodarchaeota archaeon]